MDSLAGNDEVEDSYYGVSYRRQPQGPIFPAQLSPWGQLPLEHPTIGAQH